MNNLPIRKVENIFSEVILKSTMKPNTYFIFVEDECTPSIYLKILNKVAPDISVDKITPLNSKKEVLKKFEEWKVDKTINRKCFFIVDKDFDNWKGDFVENHENLLELPVYTLENIFFKPESAEIIIKTYAYEKVEFKKKYWEEWQNQICEKLENLFICFAIVIKNDLGFENCGANPAKYIEYNHNEKKVDVKNEVVEKYIKSVEKELKTKEIEYINEFEFIKNNYLIDGVFDYSSLIKGKYLLYALLAKIRIDIDNTSIYYKSIDNGLLSTLVHELPVDYFSCFEKIRNLK